ncbi:MAG: hypothetical protein MUO76_20730 [Anaerolineaceae bacterium]|nr:hypothetical protein [Anaerolineaceae bacterium]
MSSLSSVGSTVLGMTARSWGLESLFIPILSVHTSQRGNDPTYCSIMFEAAFDYCQVSLPSVGVSKEIHPTS